MKRILLATAISAVAAPLGAQQAPHRDTPAEAAALAWDRGDFADALQGWLDLLTAPEGERWLADVALATGELYPATELTADGRAARIAPGGRWAAYEVGTGTDVATHVVDLGAGARVVARLGGTGLAFSPAGDEAAYLTVSETREMRRTREAMDAAYASRDFGAYVDQRARYQRMAAEAARIVVRDLTTGRERRVSADGLAKTGLSWSADGRALYFTGAPEGVTDRSDVYSAVPGGAAAPLTSGSGHKTAPQALAGGRHLVYMAGGVGPFGGRGPAPDRVVVRDLASGAERAFDARAFAASADGSTLALLGRDGTRNTIRVVRPADAAEPRVVVATEERIDNPALSPDGATVAYQRMPREDWEIFLVGSDGKGERRLTREIQHDLFPRFLDDATVLAVIGEGRHRRSHLYDVRTGERTRLFHNNTVRTIAPEYEWAASADGRRIVIVAERDGDTVSPERGVYVTDLRRRVTRDELTARLRAGLAAERDLAERGRVMFAPIEDDVRARTAEISAQRIYGYARDLAAFDSKYVTQPGNAKAIEYIAGQLRRWGYEPELQWFEPMPGVRSANIVATLRGTEFPDLVYVAGSHFDSVERGPGADDNSSGTTALLEAARAMAGHPQPTTIQFVWFTGEEAGLLGSREFARRALASRTRVLGALNNDMLGYANDHRLDNTIRYSNAGIRDVIHAAAMRFSDMVTYDARYYKNTDAHALFDAFGDVIGGIGSYPVLGNPHYHQAHDVLETINQQLVAEASKTTLATLMLMASSPSLVKDLEVRRSWRGRTEARWSRSPEGGIRGYIVSWGPPSDPARHSLATTEPRAVLPPGVEPGTVVRVKAVNIWGLEGWDWARAVVGR